MFMDMDMDTDMGTDMDTDTDKSVCLYACYLPKSFSVYTVHVADELKRKTSTNILYTWAEGGGGSRQNSY